MKVYPGYEGLTNYQGEQWHPVDHVIFYTHTSRLEMITLYDTIAEKLSEDERKNVLNKLLDMWAEEQIKSNEYCD